MNQGQSQLAESTIYDARQTLRVALAPPSLPTPEEHAWSCSVSDQADGKGGVKDVDKAPGQELLLLPSSCVCTGRSWEALALQGSEWLKSTGQAERSAGPRLGVQSFGPGLIDPLQASFRVVGPEGFLLSWCNWMSSARALVGHERGPGASKRATFGLRGFGKLEGSATDWLDQKVRFEKESSAVGSKSSCGCLAGSSLGREKVAEDNTREMWRRKSVHCRFSPFLML